MSGLPDPCSDHARCIAHLALDMMDAIKNAKSPRKEKSNCQVGDREWGRGGDKEVGKTSHGAGRG